MIERWAIKTIFMDENDNIDEIRYSIIPDYRQHNPKEYFKENKIFHHKKPKLVRVRIEEVK